MSMHAMQDASPLFMHFLKCPVFPARVVVQIRNGIVKVEW